MMTSTSVVPVTQEQIVTHAVSLNSFVERRQVSNKDVQIPAQSSGNNQARGSASASESSLRSGVSFAALAAMHA